MAKNRRCGFVNLRKTCYRKFKMVSQKSNLAYNIIEQVKPLLDTKKLFNTINSVTIAFASVSDNSKLLTNNLKKQENHDNYSTYEELEVAFFTEVDSFKK